MGRRVMNNLGAHTPISSLISDQNKNLVDMDLWRVGNRYFLFWELASPYVSLSLRDRKVIGSMKHNCSFESLEKNIFLKISAYNLRSLVSSDGENSEANKEWNV